MKQISFGLVFVMFIFLAGCSLPEVQATPSSPDAAYTQAAETVIAELTRVASLASPTPVVPTNTLTPDPTNTPAPTNTPVFTPTKTPRPCNLAGFVSDVTYPDNTKVAPNQTLIKTWRIQNIGTCSWNSSYLLIFDRGDGMGVTAGYTQQLTTGVVNPGQMIDLTVNLTAPAAKGTYTGYWRMRDPGGVIFGITPAGGSFLVKIIVATTTTITLTPNLAESGSVHSNGTVISGTLVVGDTVGNKGVQAFISYDISDIPSNATIIEVKNKFNTYTIDGDPFGNLGVLNGYQVTYALPLDAGNYVSGFPTGSIVDWGSTNALDNLEVQATLLAPLQAKVGANRFKIRLQFAGTNHDGIADDVVFTNPSLVVKYTTP